MTATDKPPTDDTTRIFRAEYPRAVSAVASASRGDLDLAEAAARDAFDEAIRRWPLEGLPRSPTNWILSTVRRSALRRLLHQDPVTPRDHETIAALQRGTKAPFADERLALVFTCCHPRLPFPARVALTLRFVSGFTVTEVARVFGVSEPTMAERLDRAKAAVRPGAVEFTMADRSELSSRLQGVMAVLYLIFNEGYIGSQSTAVEGRDVSAEAIATTRMLLSLLPAEDDLRGLLALMLFIQARRAARLGPDGELVPFTEQDRGQWNLSMIDEAQFLLRQARRSRNRSRYTVEARIQAEQTAVAEGAAPDWRRVLSAYDELRLLAPSPALELNRAVALAEVEGPQTALRAVDRLPEQSHLWHAVRADLLARLGRADEAAEAWRQGTEFAEGPTEQAYMATRAGREQSSCGGAASPYGEDMPATPKYTVPGLSLDDGQKLAALLQERLNALNDLMLTLKHVHWNVVGPHFIAVHEMIDPHVVEVREMVDETAERIATLGIAPLGTPKAIVEGRSWADYPLARATTTEHLKALDEVYVGLLDDHRKAQTRSAELDPITEDMLIGQIKTMELFHWFVRAHLENQGGQLEN